jgi:transposase
MSRKGFSAQEKINQERFEKLCGLHCTLGEISGFFNVSEDTVERWVKRIYKQKFADVYKQKSGAGAVSIRRKQMEVALGGNIVMLIWLGKQYLGQSEKQEIKHDSKSIQILIDKMDNEL